MGREGLAEPLMVPEKGKRVSWPLSLLRPRGLRDGPPLHPGLTKDLPYGGASVSVCLYICAHLCGGPAATVQQYGNSVICFSAVLFPLPVQKFQHFPSHGPCRKARGWGGWAELGPQRKPCGRCRG